MCKINESKLDPTAVVTEHIHDDAVVARIIREAFIGDGVTVSLVAYDTEREAFVFDTYTQGETE